MTCYAVVQIGGIRYQRKPYICMISTDPVAAAAYAAGITNAVVVAWNDTATDADIADLIAVKTETLAIANAYIDGWRPVPETIYEVDFTGLPSQNLLTGGDGVKVIDGKNWSLFNSANLQAAYINDGTHNGLYLRANANLSWNYDALLSGGAINVLLSNLSNTLIPSKWRELWLMFMWSTPHMPNANYEAAHIGMFTGTTYSTAATITRNNTHKAHSDGLTLSAQLTANGASSIYFGNDDLDDDITAIKIVGDNATLSSGKSVDGDFCNISDLRVKSISKILSAASVSLSRYIRANIAIQSGNTAGVADVLVSKMRIQTR